MKTIDRFTTNDLMTEIYEETPIRVFITLIAGGLIGTLVAAILDINTGLPTWVWSSAWYLVPLVIWSFLGLPARYGYGNSSGYAQRCMEAYLCLSKSEQREFPKNTMRMLRTGDYKVLEDFEAASNDLIALRRDSDGESIAAAREQMAQVRNNISITKKTYDELG